MNRREKILLQILIAVGVVGVIAVYLLLPAIKKNKSLTADKEELTILQSDMETLLNMQEIADGMEKTKQDTEDTFNFFNKDFASYSVDTVVNKLVDSNKLDIINLNIGKYYQRDEKEIGVVWETESTTETDEEFVTETENTGYLLGADVRMSVNGYYEDVLKFVDDLNASSKCIDIKKCTYTRVLNYNPYETAEEEELHKDEVINYINASIEMTIYSMQPYEGGKIDG